ncbi:hypothetical protein D3C80_2155220 [compost metagenome]
MSEAHTLQYRLQDAGLWGGQLNELEAHQFHRVFKQISHLLILVKLLVLVLFKPRLMRRRAWNAPDSPGQKISMYELKT